MSCILLLCSSHKKKKLRDQEKKNEEGDFRFSALPVGDRVTVITETIMKSLNPPQPSFSSLFLLIISHLELTANSCDMVQHFRDPQRLLS